MKVALTSLSFLLLFATGSLATAGEQDKSSLDDLITKADAVIVVEVLSTDYTATLADGPMVAVARALKVLKGPINEGEKFLFTETAWVGPNYQAKEHRILFLEEPAAGGSQPNRWRVLSNLFARIDFFIEKESVKTISLRSLGSFLKKVQDSGERPKKLVFKEGR